MLYGTVALLGDLAAVTNIALCIIAIVAILIAVRMVRKEGVTELNCIADILPRALDSISHCEMSVALVATIANCMKIPVEEILKEYRDDSSRRRHFILKTFQNDSLTWKLMWEFPSKFITYGHIGEELIIEAV
ncbi:unnamed protein product [Thelazia callipaeda]|uniref:CNNM transmembrane domain-containing protein n=1 Tax=Thelazia callipaeda TaxID=103827 RepID=A0A0N5D192_THECL|nr:unnamed protein product [Thelazia callipaeda]